MELSCNLRDIVKILLIRLLVVTSIAVGNILTTTVTLLTIVQRFPQKQFGNILTTTVTLLAIVQRFPQKQFMLSFEKVKGTFYDIENEEKGRRMYI